MATEELSAIGWFFVTLEAAVAMDAHVRQFVVSANQLDWPTKPGVEFSLQCLLKLRLTDGVPGLHGLPHEDESRLAWL